MVKFCGLTVKVPLKLLGLSTVEAGGIPDVAVKCIDIRRNTESEGSLLDSKLPSQSEFLMISMHFTATSSIPPTLSVLKAPSINGSSTVKLQAFTTDLKARLRTL